SLTLCRVQPGVGSRDTVRVAVGRPHRIDPDVAAAVVQVVIRLQAGTRQRRRAAHGILPQAEGLGLAVSDGGVPGSLSAGHAAGGVTGAAGDVGAARFPDWRDWPMIRLWENALTSRGWTLQSLKPLNLLARRNGEPLFALLDARGTDPDGRTMLPYVLVRGAAV